MILRLWSGWTSGANTEAYDGILDGTVAPGILERRLPGLERFEVWRRLAAEEAGGQQDEFLTAMWFRDLDSVAEFTGGDPHASVVPAPARSALDRFDAHSRHYTLRARHWPTR